MRINGLIFCTLSLGLSIFPAVSRAMDVSTDTVRIERIVFHGNRTDEKLLRKHLPFSEGGRLTPSTLKEAQTGLWDMRQFKQVNVSSAAAADGNAEIDITVQDGWYLLPFPFFSGGSGGGRGGVVLFSRNVFRQAESIMASGMSGRAGSSAAVTLQREGWSLGAAAITHSVTERRYSDGAFSSGSGFGSPPDSKHPSKYGTVTDSYDKRAGEAVFSAGVPLMHGPGGRSGVSASFGWERADLNYSDPSPTAPGDGGRQGQAFVALRSGHDGAGGAADALGAIFGFGLADMERRLAPLPVHNFTTSSEVSYHKGAAWTGSAFDYGYFLAQWNDTLTWGTHRSLSLRLAFGHGADLPPNRLLATGRELGLTGNYAREFRGDSAAGASLVYSHPFRTTRRGVWQGALFLEAARAWGSAGPGTKSGAGASFWYKFWRFPLPLGFSCTYSFDDRDPQVSAALGGRF